MTSKPQIPISTVGSTEYVDLPSLELMHVPAKVDTGADSSAIWASKIVERNQRLSFVLFDVGSVWYTGKVISVRKFKVSTIKNSFGHAERRYKVSLKVTIAGQVIVGEFTLANRARNKYPILIGRKTLHGKFVVDVTHRPTAHTPRVLMLSTKHTEVTERFAQNVASHNEQLEVVYVTYEDLDYFMGAPANRIAVRATGEDIAKFDLVYFKTTARYMDIAAATARYLERRNVPFIDEAIKHFPATSKLYQYMLLEGSGLTVPKSIFMLPGPLADSFDMITGELCLPFVLKDIHGNKGEHNYLVTDQATFRAACEQAAKDSVFCVAQSFVANDGDYRVLVLGKRIPLVIERTRADDATHLNNTSQGAGAKIVPVETLPLRMRKASIEAAGIVGRQIAGVDLVKDKTTNRWYCLEVNDGPQLASGSFVPEKHAVVADYLMRKIL